MGKSMNPLPMTTKTWSQSQVTLYWLALVLLSGAIGCAGCQTKTQKAQQNKKALQIKDRKTPPRTTEFQMKHPSKIAKKGGLLAREVGFQQSQTEINHVKSLIRFERFVQKQLIKEVQVYGKKKPTLLSIITKNSIQHMFTIDFESKKIKHIMSTLRSNNGVPIKIDRDGSGFLSYSKKKGTYSLFSETGIKLWERKIRRLNNVRDVYVSRKNSYSLIFFDSSLYEAAEYFIFDKFGNKQKNAISSSKMKYPGAPHPTLLVAQNEYVYARKIVSKNNFHIALTRAHLSPPKKQWTYIFPSPIEYYKGIGLHFSASWTAVVIESVHVKSRRKKTIHTLFVFDKRGVLKWKKIIPKNTYALFWPTEHSILVRDTSGNYRVRLSTKTGTHIQEECTNKQQLRLGIQYKVCKDLMYIYTRQREIPFSKLTMKLAIPYGPPHFRNVLWQREDALIYHEKHALTEKRIVGLNDLLLKWSK